MGNGYLKDVFDLSQVDGEYLIMSLENYSAVKSKYHQTPVNDHVTKRKVKPCRFCGKKAE